MTLKRQILIIDDEKDNRELISQMLSERFQVLTAQDGEDGIQVARSKQPDLILLDITMPKLDGLSVCDSLRKNEATRHIPVIMLTAADDMDHRVRAYSKGADDFLGKPFRAKELEARILSKVKRIEEREGAEEVIECGNLSLFLEKLEACVDGKALPLSVLEFSLLKFFVQNKERVLTRDRILEAVWNDSVVSDRTVDTHIVSLRKKLSDFEYKLSTVYGAGYILKKTA